MGLSGPRMQLKKRGAIDKLSETIHIQENESRGTKSLIPNFLRACAIALLVKVVSKVLKYGKSAQK